MPRDARHRGPVRCPLRRACLAAGRPGSGAGPDPVSGSSAGAWPSLPVRVPRPERGSGTSDRVAVIYAGRIIEVAGINQFCLASRHPHFIAFAGCGVDTGVARARSVTRGLAGTAAQSPRTGLLVARLQPVARSRTTSAGARIRHSKPTGTVAWQPVVERTELPGQALWHMAGLRAKSRQQDKVSAHAPGI